MYVCVYIYIYIRICIHAYYPSLLSARGFGSGLISVWLRLGAAFGWYDNIE